MLYAAKKDGKKIVASDVLNILQKEWLPSKKLADSLGVNIAKSKRIISTLTAYGFVAMTGSGRAREGYVTESGMQALSRIGNIITQQHKPFYQQDAA